MSMFYSSLYYEIKKLNENLTHVFIHLFFSQIVTCVPLSILSIRKLVLKSCTSGLVPGFREQLLSRLFMYCPPYPRVF